MRFLQCGSLQTWDCDRKLGCVGSESAAAAAARRRRTGTGAPRGCGRSSDAFHMVNRAAVSEHPCNSLLLRPGCCYDMDSYQCSVDVVVVVVADHNLDNMDPSVQRVHQHPYTPYLPWNHFLAHDNLPYLQQQEAIPSPAAHYYCKNSDSSADDSTVAHSAPAQRMSRPDCPSYPTPHLPPTAQCADSKHSANWA